MKRHLLFITIRSPGGPFSEIISEPRVTGWMEITLKFDRKGELYDNDSKISQLSTIVFIIIYEKKQWVWNNFKEFLW